MSFTRRQVLTGLAGLSVIGVAAGAVRYWVGRPTKVTTHDYEVIAAPFDLELVPGHMTPAWGYNNLAPGIEIRARQGDRLRVRFINKLPEWSTIHWHGLRIPIEMDGVPYVSQLPVLPGEYFDYEFDLPDAGSYWYHPHMVSGPQLGRGLVGPIIVDERDGTDFKHDYTLCLKTWPIDEKGQFTEFSIPRDAARGGTLGTVFTINGKVKPELDLPAGQIVRLRLLNVDNTATYRLRLDNKNIQIYAIDGQPVTPARKFPKEYRLGPGMRLDLAYKVPAAGTTERMLNGPLTLARFNSIDQNLPEQTTWPRTLPANPLAEPDLENAEVMRFNFEWAGMLSVPNKDNYTFWQINGQAWDIQDNTCADRPIAVLKKGQSYIFELRNISQYQHPIHLHGMAFKILSSNRHKIDPYFTDTYLLDKQETARVALVADNIGTWMFHCHVIDHMETGLMAAIKVEK